MFGRYFWTLLAPSYISSVEHISLSLGASGSKGSTIIVFPMLEEYPVGSPVAACSFKPSSAMFTSGVDSYIRCMLHELYSPQTLHGTGILTYIDPFSTTPVCV